jgi:Tfp pilus assembly protein PilX
MQRKGDYEIGKGKPPKHAQFQRGQTGNPKGKTSEQKRLELANAEAAMRIRERILRAAEAKLNECSTDEVLEKFVEAAMLKLLKDSEDRGLGSPVQAVTNPDGTLRPAPTQIIFQGVEPKPDDEG